VKLKYLATKIGSGKTPRGGNEVYSESGVVFLRSCSVEILARGSEEHEVVG
jgi:type I restriction enzyme S subunit